jgi:TonB family protein
MVSVVNRIAAPFAALLLGCMAAIDGSLFAFAQAPRADTEIDFNIPAQSLASALVAYSAATGFEIYYNAALAVNHRSGGVVGHLLPMEAVQMLLKSSGYVARVTAPGALVIGLAPNSPSAAPEVVPSRRQLEPYFAMIQRRISDALCKSSELSSVDREMLLQVWLAPSGAVSQADIIDSKGERAEDQSAIAAIRGLVFVAPPPAMPQPINMVIFPPSDASPTCPPTASQRRAG